MPHPGGRPGNTRSKATRLRIANEISQCMQLASHGLTNLKIAEMLQISDDSVARRLDEGFRELPYPETERARQASLVRLSQLDERLIGPLQSNDFKIRIKAVEAARRVEERRARLLGLDVPVTQSVEVAVEQTPYQDPVTELARLQAQLAIAQAMARIDAETVADVQRPALTAAPSA